MVFSLSLPNIPQYCQKSSNYCGAASAQMIMNGYPDTTARKLIDQSDIYNWIQLNQTEAPPYKAPGMVRDAIHHFNDPPGSDHFVATTSSNANDEMYKILLWMRRTDYPAVTMISGNHWVVITGFETDLDPEGNSNTNLNSINIHNPLPFCGGGSEPPATGGAYEHLTGTIWLNNYYKPVTLWSGSSWNGKYVGVYEPPEESGRIEACKPVYGRRIIRNLSSLRQSASLSVKRFHLADRPGMRQFAELAPLEPMLARVRERRGRSYYIVPFGTDPTRVQAAMILNAYTGDYEQSIVLSKDCFFKFLTRKQALKLAVEKTRVSPEWLSQPRLIFTQSIETPSRFFPVWKVTLRRDVFVTPRAEAVYRLASTEEELWSRFERRN